LPRRGPARSRRRLTSRGSPPAHVAGRYADRLASPLYQIEACVCRAGRDQSWPLIHWDGPEVGSRGGGGRRVGEPARASVVRRIADSPARGAQSAGRSDQRPNCQRRSSGFRPGSIAGNTPGIRARSASERVSSFRGGTHSPALRAKVLAGTAGGWGRSPEGDAFRSEAAALGARPPRRARPQPPNFVTRHVTTLNHAPGSSDRGTEW
jgi:hypothetical protein